MRLRWIAFTLITLCLIGGLVAGIYARSIEAALTTQPANNAQSVAGPGKATPTPTPPASGKPTPPAKSSVTPLPGGMSVLAHDTFRRAPQVFWGTASDGHAWRGDANSIEVFSIAQNAGLIAAGQGAFNAILGPAITDAEIVASVSANHFAAGGFVNIGIALRWMDGNNWYKALINGTQLEILSRVRGATTVLASMPFIAHDGVSYTLRFRALGARLLVKVWQSNQPEPANWLLQATDTALAQGMGGIRVVLQNTTIIRVTSFLETTIMATT
jgi:hypothetical protein